MTNQASTATRDRSSAAGGRQAAPIRPVPPPVECEGDPFSMGAAQGAVLGDGVAATWECLRDLEALRLLKPGWLPFPVFRRLAESRATRAWRRCIRRRSTAADRQAEGLALAAGVRPGQLHLLHLLEPMLSDLGRQTRVPPLGGCSALAVTGNRSKSGEPILAHNFDYLPLVQPYYTLRRSRPTGSLRSLDFTLAPLVGTVDGVNEAGLCIATNYAYAADPAECAGTVTMAVAEALGRCRTVEEAVGFLSATPRWGGGLLMLADADGRIASLELSNRSAALRIPEDGSDHLCHTNRYRTDSMRAAELPAAATYSELAPSPLRGLRVHESADRRQRRLTEILEDSGPLDEGGVLAVMSDHGPEGAGSADTLCMHGDYWHTTATVQLFPRSRRMRVAFAPACLAEPVEQALE